MISAQTLRVCREGKPVPTFPDHALAWISPTCGIRKARSAVKIPEEYLQLSAPKTVAPAEIEDAFIKVNPGLSSAAIAVACDKNRLSEVRICMGKDLQFRACEEIDGRACRRDQVEMPPIRGG